MADDAGKPISEDARRFAAMMEPGGPAADIGAWWFVCIAHPGAYAEGLAMAQAERDAEGPWLSALRRWLEGSSTDGDSR